MNVPMNVLMDVQKNTWSGKVKLNIAYRKYSPKRTINIPLSSNLDAGEYNIRLSKEEIVDVPMNVLIEKAGKDLFKIFDAHFKDIKKVLTAGEKQSLDEIEGILGG